jgi:hypothetical protein
MNIQPKIIVMQVALFALVQFAFAQTQKTATLSDRSKVQYTVDPSEKLNGSYTVTQDSNKVYLRGAYKDGQRVGNWYAFNNDTKVFLRYNYDLKKLVSLDTTSVGRIEIDIKADDANVKQKAAIAFPIASIDQYISLLAAETKKRILSENKKAYGILTVDLITAIDADGKPTYSVKYNADGVDITKRINISNKAFDLEWIPATYEGKTYPAVFTVKAQIDLNASASGPQRFIWVY